MDMMGGFYVKHLPDEVAGRVPEAVVDEAVSACCG